MKNRCAWLNHSSNPGAFIRLVHSHPNIRLWFSGAVCPRQALAFPALAKSGFFSSFAKVLLAWHLPSGMLLCQPHKRA